MLCVVMAMVLASQDFTPPEAWYDVIWVQWVMAHLTDGRCVHCVHVCCVNLCCVHAITHIELILLISQVMVLGATLILNMWVLIMWVLNMWVLISLYTF